MRFVQALALAGSSVAFAEHKAFQEKYIIGCSTEQIATANSITDSFRTCALSANPAPTRAPRDAT